MMEGVYLILVVVGEIIHTSEWVTYQKNSLFVLSTNANQHCLTCTNEQGLVCFVKFTYNHAYLAQRGLGPKCQSQK